MASKPVSRPKGGNRREFDYKDIEFTLYRATAQMKKQFKRTDGTCPRCGKNILPYTPIYVTKLQVGRYRLYTFQHVKCCENYQDAENFAEIYLEGKSNLWHNRKGTGR